MLTVKQITLSGEEFIWQALAPVSYTPAELRSGEPRGKNVVSFNTADGVASTIASGTVFVMNEAGSTLARYDLGASMVPIGQQCFGDPHGASPLEGPAEAT